MPQSSYLLQLAQQLGSLFNVCAPFLHVYPAFYFPSLHSAFSAKESQKTYMALKQPPYRPPPSVFGPTWTLLYGLMGYAAYRAYNTGMNSLASTEKHLLTKQGATLYTIQLGLNLIWMPLFFVAKRPIEATVDIVALTGVTGYLTYIWGQVDPVAGWALAPYLGWLVRLCWGYGDLWSFNGIVLTSIGLRDLS